MVSGEQMPRCRGVWLIEASCSIHCVSLKIDTCMHLEPRIRQLTLRIFMKVRCPKSDAVIWIWPTLEVATLDPSTSPNSTCQVKSVRFLPGVSWKSFITKAPRRLRLGNWTGFQRGRGFSTTPPASKSLCMPCKSRVFFGEVYHHQF